MPKSLLTTYAHVLLPRNAILRGSLQSSTQGCKSRSVLHTLSFFESALFCVSVAQQDDEASEVMQKHEFALQHLD